MLKTSFNLQLFGEELPAATATPPAATATPPAATATPPAATATPPAATATATPPAATATPPAATATPPAATATPPAVNPFSITGDPTTAVPEEPPAAPATEPAKPEVPTEYKFDVPEGFDQPVEAFTKFAKENGLTQEQAQGAVDFYTKSLIPQFQASVDAKNSEWSAKTMTEFGGEGVELAKKAYSELATPELTKLLNDTGLGSHPEVVRLFNGLGKSISESKLILGRMNSTKSDAQILFGDSVK